MTTSGPRIFCRPIWGLFAVRVHLLARCLLLESSENFSGPESQLWNCIVLVLKSWSLNMFLTEEKPRGLLAKFGSWEPRRCEDIKEIVEPEIGPKSLRTFAKRPQYARSMLPDIETKSFVCSSECDKKKKDDQCYTSRYIFIHQVLYIQVKFLNVYVKTINSLSMHL